MSQRTMIELDKLLQPDVLRQFQAEADRQQTPIENLVRAAIERYLVDVDEPLEDTPDDKIESDFRQSWHEAMTGETIPARTALAALRRAADQHDDKS